jgi:hypothetical protein
VGWTVSFLFHGGGLIAVATLPGHHPADLADPPGLRRWLDDWSPEASATPAAPDASATPAPDAR